MTLLNRTCRTWVLGPVVVALCVASTGAADPPPAFEVTTRPATAKKGPVVKIKGKLGFTYNAFPTVADDTTFDLTEATWSSRDIHPTSTMFIAGNQPVPPKDIRMVGGVFHGSIPLDWSWSVTHAFGGSAFLTIATGRQTGHTTSRRQMP
jgi:hypothetical protein